MSAALIAPLIASLTIALIATASHRRVRPRIAAALLTGAILGVAAAAVPTLAVLTVGFLVHVPLLGGGFEWCRAVLGIHAAVDPWVGGSATVALAVGSFRFGRAVRAWRRHRFVEAGAPAVVDSHGWFAYSMPGPGGRIAISSGLADSLSIEELEVVLAHERGHACHRHDRHLLAAELAAGLVPPVEWLRRRLRFTLERWADEAAVQAVGGDRERVAYTLARVAFGPSGPTVPLPAFNGVGVAARVDELLRPRSLRYERIWGTAIAGGVIAVAVAAGVQAHHVAGLLVTLCPG